MAPSAETLEGHLKEATRQLYLADPDTVTVNSVRQRAEEQNDLEKGFFVAQDWKARSKTLITEFVQTLLANEPSSSIPEPEDKQGTRRSVKRSSTDELSPPPPAKRQKATSVTKHKGPKPKREPSSSALSDLSDSDVPPKKEKGKKKIATKKAEPKRDPDSDSELSDLDLSDDQPKRKGKATKPPAPRKSKKEESESELSELNSSEDKPKPVKKRGGKSKKIGASESELSELSSSEDKPKPAKRRGGKSKKLGASDDSDSGADTKASASRPKGKRSVSVTKPSAKSTKAELNDEDGLSTGDDVKKGGANEDSKTTEGNFAKDEDLEGSNKAKKEESKPLVDDSDSSLSSVLDDPPPKKRKGKGAGRASKPKPPTSKEPTGDEAEIKKLQGQLVKCGMRKIWGIELKKYGSDGKAKIRHLRDMLRSVGMDGRFSEAKAREIKERRELMGELEAVNEMNELWGLEGRQGRASRSKATRKSLKEESNEENDEDDEQKPKDDDEEEEEKGVKAKTTSRVSKRMADLAFLGSDSESE